MYKEIRMSGLINSSVAEHGKDKALGSFPKRESGGGGEKLGGKGKEGENQETYVYAVWLCMFLAESWRVGTECSLTCPHCSQAPSCPSLESMLLLSYEV